MTVLPIENSSAAQRGRRSRRTVAAATGAVSFASLGVPAPVTGVLTDAGITTPFPIQAATLPDALAGRDVLGRGRTGSGKTIAFSIPLVTALAGGHTMACRPRGLVLVPTRELASQVQAVLAPLAQAVGLTVVTIFGGSPQSRQVAALRARTDIVVACPGRLADLIEQGHCQLGDVEISVIDEADHMADLGFLPVVSRLLRATPPDGQRMLFSATLDKDVDVLVRRFLSEPARHAVDPVAAASDVMVHRVLTVAPADRVSVVAALAGGKNRSLIFTRTRRSAHRLARQLTAAHVPAVELHGDLGQNVRERNLASFASGAARVMVATDIAARGIHVDGIDLVIHADPPAEHKAYLHRSGRTARAGAAGVVITLQTPAQEREVRALMRKANVVPLAAKVRPDSALLRSIAGEPAEPIAPVTQPAGRETAAAATPATGRGAVAMSTRYRGRGRR
ncbi:MAG TPA: DEAD/DEAH box helicase [Streptosporangiaceae bacterium]